MAARFRAFEKKIGVHHLFAAVIAAFALFLDLPAFGSAGPDWGFWAHKRVNRLAVFRLPPEMQVFYKKHIDYLTEHATDPDKRRYAVLGEAERHFIDMDVYGDSALSVLPRLWNKAVERYGEDSLRKHGIVPWQIQHSAYQLTEAFKLADPARILKISADLGHYVADAHVPLHTTRNYNGQLSGQHGIHGLWESRLPELFATDFDLWIGPAKYCDDVAQQAWHTVAASHLACDSVLRFEKALTIQLSADEKYSYELRNNILTRSYSREFSDKYHKMLSMQVQNRMKASVQMVGDIWYSCWVNAGQPDLSKLAGYSSGETDTQKESEERQSWLRKIFPARPESED